MNKKDVYFFVDKRFVLLIILFYLAAGCCTSISSRIVAPSLVILISPIESTSILSIPLGPKLVLTNSATILAAVILFLLASLSFVSVVPSFKTRIGTCWPWFSCGHQKVHLCNHYLAKNRNINFSWSISSEFLDIQHRRRWLL